MNEGKFNEVVERLDVPEGKFSRRWKGGSRGGQDRRLDRRKGGGKEGVRRGRREVIVRRQKRL